MTAKSLKAARASVIIVAAVAFLSLAFSLILIERARAMYIEPTPQELAVALTRAGLDAEALTAAGLNITQTEAVVDSVRTYLINNPAELSDADAAVAQARITHDQLLREVRAGIASPEEIDQLPGARTALANALSDQADALDAIFEAGVNELSLPAENTLAQIRLNEHWRFPTEFLVLTEWTEAEWVELRNALADERISADSGDDPHEDYQTLLTNTRALPAVSTANANLDANLNAITSAWNDECGL